jgi:hypothetical protein
MRRLFLLGGIVAAAAGVAALAVQGCASVSCNDTDTCPGASGDGSTDGPSSDHQLTDAPKDGKGKDAGDGGTTTDGTTDGESGPTCDLKLPPSKDNCVLQDGNGLFVAPAPYGNDSTGTGTMEQPYATIHTAVSNLSKSTVPRIYVCNGAYTDQVTVTSGVGIFGGLTCGTGDGGVSSGGDGGGDGGSAKWAYAAGTRGTVAGTSADFVLEINMVTETVDIEDLEFDGATATTPGQSSIAAYVNASTKVSMERVKLVGGTGATGTTGGSGTPGTTPTGANGDSPVSGNLAAGAPQVSCSCGSATTVGGKGGDDDGTSSSTTAGQGGPGLDGQANGSSTPYPANPNPSDTGAGGAGAIESSATACVMGFQGAQPPEAAGTTAGTATYTLSASGFASSGVGGTGVTGSIGQGGGGGGGGALPLGDLTGGGGSGGCGGCGGTGGSGGGGGGSSIGLVVVASTVTINASTVLGGTGGPGGPGGPGGGGGAGGLGGTQSAGGCGGGAGGQGGKGGPGGGGAGGASFGIAQTSGTGTTVMLISTTPTAGTPGTGGLDGDGTTTYQGATGSMVGQQSL